MDSFYGKIVRKAADIADDISATYLIIAIPYAKVHGY